MLIARYFYGIGRCSVIVVPNTNIAEQFIDHIEKAKLNECDYDKIPVPLIDVSTSEFYKCADPNRIVIIDEADFVVSKQMMFWIQKYKNAIHEARGVALANKS